MIKQFIIIILATLAHTITLSAIEPNSSIQVEAKAKGAAHHGKNGAKSQERKIEIKISKTAASKAASLSVKWYIYGRSMKTRELVEIESGEITQDMKDSLTQVIETPAVTIKGQREFKVSSRGRRGRRGSRMQVKTIPASGNQYYGFAIMAYEGGELVATKFSQPSIAKLHDEK